MKFEHEMVCLYCNEMFDISEDYKNHLRLEHNLSKNLDQCVQLAMKNAGMPVIPVIKNEVVEEVTIDDDSDIEITNEETDTKEESGLTEDAQEKIRDIAMSTSRKLFEKLRNMADEDAGSREEKYVDVEETENDAFYSDKSLSSFFDRMRSKIKKIDFSEVVEHLVSSNDTKVIEYPKIAVTNNIKEDIIKPEKSLSCQTLFFCPLQGCAFSTTKEKIQNEFAIGNHIGKDHGLTNEEIKRNMQKEPGMYKFKKIKKSV